MDIILEDVKLFQSRTTAPQPYIIREGYEEVELLLSGSVHWGESRKLFGRGTLFWHHSGEHTICDTNPTSPYRCMTFVFQVAQAQAKRQPKLSYWKRLDEIDGFVDEMITSFAGCGSLSKDLAEYAYSRLKWQGAEVVSSQQSIPTILQKLLLEIEQNPERDWSIDCMAEYCTSSTSLIHYWFKRFLNKTPHQVLCERRISHARHLLLSTNLNMNQIADKSGYQHSETFYRSFKRLAGITPKRYRQKNKPAQFNVLKN